ncbi:MAG: rhomboid family intramembrane serine protease [Anaerolineales bacterium]|jgi:membrane associated rhomboid family serine protease
MIPLRDTIRSRHFPIMTWVILIANTLVFLLMLVLNNSQLQSFVDTFAMVPARWQTNPVWLVVTIFTSMFMHSGWMHFLSNMWILFIFGDNVEDQMGPFGFLAFYLLSGVAAGLMQLVAFPTSTLPTLGASGAIAGVMGAYVVLYPRARVVTLVFFFFITTINIPAILYLGIWFITQFFSGIASLGQMAVGGVAWWAHIGGFVFGLLLVRRFIFRPPPVPQILDYNAYRDPRDDRPW